MIVYPDLFGLKEFLEAISSCQLGNSWNSQHSPALSVSLLCTFVRMYHAEQDKFVKYQFVKIH